jgi:hypothetical protein
MIAKLIIFQAFFSFFDSEASSVRKYPLAAFLETDAAVTFCDRSEFWDLEAELEVAAVAVALVGLKFSSGIRFRHGKNGSG